MRDRNNYSGNGSEEGLRQTVRKGVRIAKGCLCAVAVAWVLSCEEPPRATTVTVRPSTAELAALGGTVQLTADVEDQDGQAMSGARVTWASGSAGVATVGGSGLVTAAANGLATITATAGQVSGSAAVTVRQVVTAVTVTASADSLVEGDTLRFSAEATDANGHAVAGVGFEWSSGDTLVAIVEESGLVTGVATGGTEIVAASSGVEGRAPLAVVAPAPATVGVTPDTAEFSAIGQTEKLAAEVRDQIGRVMEDVPVSWTSGDTAVAAVDSAGLVTAAGNGSVAVTATSGNASGTAVVLVAQVADSVTVSPARDTVAPGDTLRLAAEAFDENGHRVDGAAFAWSSSEDSVAGVDASGLVRGAAEGTAEITAAAGDARGTSEITVKNPDRAVLVALYEATGGPNWANNDNWLTEAPLDQWHGVATNRVGRVTGLSMRLNDMNGPIPPEIGELSKLEVLELVNSKLQAPGLTGRIPAALGRLANLKHLNLNSNSLTGSIPPELGGLASLERLILPYNFLSGSIPAELGDLEKLVDLELHANRLEGSIPAELGNLSQLRGLWLFENRLSGPIPGALGDLSRLDGLGLNYNALTGPIPPELGRLSNLRRLWLYGNALESIPPELGDLSSVVVLWLYENRLSGSIPAELGQLAELEEMLLFRNDLTGSLPPELADMESLKRLWLSDNELTGSVPAEFGDFPALDELDLTNNPGMSGPLPVELKDLGRFSALLAGGTELCAPSDAAFQRWLRRVPRQRVAGCSEGEPPTVYLVQAAQSREFPAPLVADEKALLRVFVTSPNAGGAGIPPVTATFFSDGEEVHVAEISAKSTPIPKEVDEGDLDKSSNAVIPDSVLLEGLELVVEVDPDSTLHDSITIVRRIPETGRMNLDVVAVPTFDLTAIPFLWTEDPDSVVLDIVAGMARDPDSHDMLFETRTLLPVDELEVTAHEAVWTSSRSAFDILRQTDAIRVAEGGTRYHQGILKGASGAAGVAHSPGWSSFSEPLSSVMAHEFAHNMSLFHAPCGGAPGADPAFPQPDGSIGAWGYDFRDGGALVSPKTADLMSYCRPRWISDYHFGTALRYRMWAEDVWEEDDPQSRGLLLWGGTDAEGEPFLDPAFVIDAPPALPARTGDHRLSGHAADGRELFSISFAMADVADGDGSRFFAFALPARPEWADGLAGITLEGPGGSAALGLEAEAGMAMLRDPETGQVRGFVRVPEPGLLLRTVAVALAAEPGLAIQFSAGIPDAEAWRR